MKTSSGGQEIIASGLVHSYKKNDVDFLITASPEMVVGVRLTKKEGEKSSIDMNIESPSKAVFVFTNPDSMNFGPSEPVDVGVFGGRQLSASLRINVFGDFSSFEIAYTFFLGAEVK
jgi:hypothetical protein